MRKINYGLIVSDFDGTLIDSKQRVLPEVRSSIREYVSAGGIFAVCTGRMMRSILPQVRKLGLNGVVVAHQGAVIAEIESGKLIKNSGMSPTDASAVCRTVEELGCTYNVYSDEYLYTNIPDGNKYRQLYEKIIGVKGEFVGGKLSDFTERNELFCQKIACLVMPKERDALYTALSNRLSDKFDVTCSADCLVEISQKNENKGEGLRYLAAYYGVPIEKTVAVGDNLNDLSMILAAGVGIAVGNAEKSLKDAADFISVSNNEGAIAQIINKYGFA